MLKLMFFVASVLIFSATSQAQAIYSWRDANGVLNYSDKPPTILPIGGALIVQQPTTKPTLLGGVVQPITSGPIQATPGSTTTAIGDTSVFDGTTTSSGTTTTAPTGGTSPVPSNLPISFSYTFAIDPIRSAAGIGASDDGIWWVERVQDAGRVTIVNNGRDGTTALRLHTEPGDIGIPAGNPAERAAVGLPQKTTDCYQGREQWWEVSMLFPSDFVYPPDGSFFATMGFHGTPATGSGNLQVHVPGGNLILRVHGGVLGSAPKAVAGVGPITKNMWYDFVYHVKWSDGSDGFFQAWVNGKQYMNYTGPTLYENEGCYFKLNNYHMPFGQPTSVIFDRVIRRDVHP